MSRYFDYMFTGEMKYYNIFNFVLLLSVAIVIPFLPIQYWIMIFLIETLAFSYWMEKRDNELRAKHSGERYFDTITMREKGYREDVIFMFLNDYPLEMHKEPSVPFDQLPEYKDAKVYVMKRRLLADEEIDRRLMHTKKLVENTEQARKKEEKTFKKKETKKQPQLKETERPSLPETIAPKPSEVKEVKEEKKGKEAKSPPEKNDPKKNEENKNVQKSEKTKQ